MGAFIQEKAVVGRVLLGDGQTSRKLLEPSFETLIPKLLVADQYSLLCCRCAGPSWVPPTAGRRSWSCPGRAASRLCTDTPTASRRGSRLSSEREHEYVICYYARSRIGAWLLYYRREDYLFYLNMENVPNKNNKMSTTHKEDVQ